MFGVAIVGVSNLCDQIIVSLLVSSRFRCVFLDLNGGKAFRLVARKEKATPNLTAQFLRT